MTFAMINKLYIICRIVKNQIWGEIRTDEEDKNKASYNCEDCETNTADNAVLDVEFIRIYCVFQGRFQ